MCWQDHGSSDSLGQPSNTAFPATSFSPWSLPLSANPTKDNLLLESYEK